MCSDADVSGGGGGGQSRVWPAAIAIAALVVTACVDDLEALLGVIEAEPPYVLVGFSMGGIFTQVYAATHPDDVAGLVLVESNHPDEAHQFEAHLTAEQIEADRAAAAANPEGIDILASFDEAAAPLPDVPLVVVTATEGGADWPPGWDPAVFDRLRAEQQADLASPRAERRADLRRRQRTPGPERAAGRCR